MSINYYQILNLDPKCSLEEIKSSYKRLALIYHPDRNITDEQNKAFNEKKFKEISEAYQILSNDEQRKKYDSNIDIDCIKFKSPEEIFNFFFKDVSPEYINLSNEFIKNLINSPEQSLIKKILFSLPEETEVFKIVKIISTMLNPKFKSNQNNVVNEKDSYKNDDILNNSEFKSKKNDIKTKNIDSENSNNPKFDINDFQSNFNDEQLNLNQKDSEYNNNVKLDNNPISSDIQSNTLNNCLPKKSDVKKSNVGNSEFYFQEYVNQEYKDNINSQNRESNLNNSSDMEFKKTENIITTIYVSLEDIYKGEVKKIDITRIRKQLNGSFLKEKKTFILPLNKPQIIFINEADELPNYKEAGDIIINLECYNHPVFKKYKKNSLITDIPVSLYEYYYGTKFNLKLLNSKYITIFSGKNLYKKSLKKINGLGLPGKDEIKGDLYINFILKLPELDINDKNIAKLLFKLFIPINKEFESKLENQQQFLLESETYDSNDNETIDSDD